MQVSQCSKKTGQNRSFSLLHLSVSFKSKPVLSYTCRVLEELSNKLQQVEAALVLGVSHGK